jgi:predicted CoA-binding protein
MTSAAQDDTIERAIRESKTIAVVGISDREDRPSFGVAQYLSQYYQIIPVNPKLERWQGRVCYPDLVSIPREIEVDMVDVFRRSSEVMPVVQEALVRPVRFIWLQLGISSEEAAALAGSHQIGFVQNACLAVEHSRLRKR